MVPVPECEVYSIIVMLQNMATTYLLGPVLLISLFCTVSLGVKKLKWDYILFYN